MESIRRRLGGYLLGRSIVLVALMPLIVAFVVRQGMAAHAPFRGYIALTAAAFGLSLVTAVAARKGVPPRGSVALQPFWDIFFATGMLYLSGGWHSPFVLLYPFAVIGAAALLYRRGAFLAASAASIAYGGLIALQVNHLILPYNPFPDDVAAGPGLPLRLAFHILAFYVVAFLSGYLAEEVRRARERLGAAEEEILQLEKIQEAMLRSMTGGLAAFDGKERTMFLNETGRELLEQAGVDTARPGALARVFDLSRTGRSEARVGTTGDFIFGYTTRPLTSPGGESIGTILSFQDLTEVHRLEEELARADRLAAVGRLAAGLAHEIRNPLAGLSGSVEMLKGGLAAEGERDRALLDIILRETERLNRLVSNFLLYARPPRTHPIPFDFRGFVEEMAFFFRQGEGQSRLTLANEVEEGLMVRADREQMEQLFLNLFRNAAEAAGGEVEVRVAASRSPELFTFTVTDDGPGIAPEIAAKAFEPFVSTKSGGTGLGLALVHRIAQNHGGDVVLETLQEGGALFTFRLPIDETWNESS